MNDMTPLPTADRRPAPVETPLGWLRHEIDRLFDGFGRPAQSMFEFARRDFGLSPAIEMTQSGEGYRLTAELPGIKDEEVGIAVADGVLTMTGQKREDDEHQEDGFLISERRYGAFKRQIKLPADVDASKITAKAKRGVLTIFLPKDEKTASHARKIEIGKD